MLNGQSGPCSDALWNGSKTDLRRTIELADGSIAPLYVLRFDRLGASCDDAARQELSAAIATGEYSDFYLFCPGWSDSWYPAVGWVESFATGFEKIRPRAVATPAISPALSPATAPVTQPRPAAYKPIYALVLWPMDVPVDAYPGPSPSASPRAVLGEADRKAVSELLGTDVDKDTLNRVFQGLSDRGHGASADRLKVLLAGGAMLTPPEQVELAECLAPLYGPQEEPSAPGPRYAVATGRDPIKRIAKPVRAGLLAVDPAPVPPIDRLALLDVWKKRSAAIASVDAPPAGNAAALNDRRAGVAETVRWALRATDLRLSKDRAFRVGRSGVADLLADARAAAPAMRVRGVGYSGGAEVLLSAVSRIDKDATVESLLLIQPLVSAYAMAPAPGIGFDVAPGLEKAAKPGGYRAAVTGRVTSSLVTTYSAADWVLARYAANALRHPPLDGLATPDTWANGDGFAQLGAVGFVGAGPDATRVPLTLVNTPAARPNRYPRLASPDGGVAVLAIDAGESVRGHGEINSPSFWWILADQCGQ